MSDPANPVKTWFITGCSRGFGRALAERALELGQRVIATARDVRSISDLERSGRCLTLALDVTDPDQGPSAIETAAAHWGTLDVLVNNAGFGLVGAIEETSDVQSRRIFDANFHGPMRLIRHALPILRRQRSGHIVNISAAAALGNYAGFGYYGAAKAALDLASESLRAEVAPLGIRVTIVHPGPFRTGFISTGLERAEQGIHDYAATSGRFAKWLDSADGRQPGDPGRAASLIVDTLLSGQAPLHLPLGGYILKKMADKAAALAREAAQWQDAAKACDFPT